MVRNVCFTGHRHINDVGSLKTDLTQKLEEIVSNGAADFYAGGAYGFDILCEETVLVLKERNPYIKLHLILPCPPEEQTENWSDTDKSDYSKILSKADTVEICSEHFTKDCMRKRNARLVELADCCICYYHNSRSGTGQTVRMAAKKAIQVINLYKQIIPKK